MYEEIQKLNEAVMALENIRKTLDNLLEQQEDFAKKDFIYYAHTMTLQTMLSICGLETYLKSLDKKLREQD